MYHVLRTISLIIPKLQHFTELQIIFQQQRFQDILQACQSHGQYVREQALHIVSLLGEMQETGLKQRVLSAGAIPVIAKVRLCSLLHQCMYPLC
jgi:hypothetical protein